MTRPRASVSRTSRRRAPRSFIAVSVTAALALGTFGLAAAPSAAAPAAPPSFSISPASGSSLGGEEVTVTPPPGVTFTSVSAGSHHSLAIGSDGNTYAWGSNSSGRLGIGTTAVDVLTPTPVVQPTGVTFTSVAAGGLHSLAVGSDGNVYAWGFNGDWQLGNVSPASSTVPIVAPVLVGGVVQNVTFTSVAAGSAHSLALDAQGVVYSWGAGGSGQLGYGGPPVNSWAVGSIAAPPAVTFTSVSAGGDSSAALASNGDIYMWGAGGSGALGDGASATSSTPVLVSAPGGVRFTSVSVGMSFAVANGADGNTYAWGRNDVGQLGDGSSTNASTPVVVAAPGGVTFDSVDAGTGHSVAVGSDGSSYAWGFDAGGRLGDGDPEQNSSTPVRVSAPSGVTFVTVSAGGIHTLAVGSDGETYSWGDNSRGQLGDGEGGGFRISPVPVQVSSPQISVTSVSFDGTAGAGLAHDAVTGTWAVTTPPHAAAQVDVVVAWSLGGVVQPPLMLTSGFTFLATGPALAATGAGIQELLALAGMLLALGVVVVLRSRRAAG